MSTNNQIKPEVNPQSLLIKPRVIRDSAKTTPLSSSAHNLEETSKETYFKKPAQGDLSEFPVHTLPQPYRDIVKEGAASFNCSPDLLALPLFGIVSTITGNKRDLQVTQSRVEKGILFLGAIASKGSGKSPALNLLMEPVDKIQKQLMHSYQTARNQISDPKSCPPPKREVVCAQNTTGMALIKRLEDSPRGILLSHDELSGFFKELDKTNGHSISMSQVLELYDGRSILIDRVDDDSNRYIENPFVSIYGGIQPDVFRDCCKGKVDNGFMDRFQFLSIKSRPIQLNDSKGIDPRVISNYHKAITDLRGINTELTLSLSDDAEKVFKNWNSAYVDYVNNSYSNAEDHGWHSKFRSRFYRFVLPLQLMSDRASTSITKETAVSMVEIMNHFLAHGEAVNEMMANCKTKKMSPMERTYALLKRNNGRGNVRDLVSSRIFGNAGDARQLIANLVAKDDLRWTDHRKQSFEMPPYPVT